MRFIYRPIVTHIGEKLINNLYRIALLLLYCSLIDQFYSLVPELRTIQVGLNIKEK